MTDEETVRRRVEIARAGLRGYQEWLGSDDPARPIDPQALGKLASVARWYIEERGEQP